MSQQLKIAKDSLVSSLYELSKAANEASSNVVDFYNAAALGDEDATLVYGKLADSLKLLTAATTNVSQSANQIIGDVYSVPQQGISGQIANINTNGDVKPKRKIDRDPNAPKKPLTVFFAYSAYLRQLLKEDREEKGLAPLSSTEITQEISKKWSELSDRDKEDWKEAYQQELDKYHTVKEKYLEAKKNGDDVTIQGPNPAPVPIPAHLSRDRKKRNGDEDRKEKKKRSRKRKSTVDTEVSP